MNQKQEKIVNMFNVIASSYDRTNRVMSLGVDIRWRKEACKKAFEALEREKIECLVDVACGTGDMIIHWHEQANLYGKQIVKSVGIDPSNGMLQVAQEKLATMLASGELRLYQGEAKQLELEESSVDILSIAYGLRNVIEIDAALDEFVRVLKPGGILVILEFMNNDSHGLLGGVMRFYTRKILPFVGALVSRNYEAYKYLPDSIQDFVSTSELVSRLEKRGMNMHFLKGYSANISTLYVGVKV